MAHWCNKQLSNEEEKMFKELDSTNKDAKTIKSFGISTLPVESNSNIFNPDM